MRWWSALAVFARHHRIMADIAIGILFGLAIEFVAVPLVFADGGGAVHPAAPVRASIAVSFFPVLLAVPSALLFKSGAMLDLAVPSFGVVAHKFLLEVVERVELVRSRGLRALLTDHHEAG